MTGKDSEKSEEFFLRIGRTRHQIEIASPSRKKYYLTVAAGMWEVLPDGFQWLAGKRRVAHANRSMERGRYHHLITLT